MKSNNKTQVYNDLAYQEERQGRIQSVLYVGWWLIILSGLFWAGWGVWSNSPQVVLLNTVAFICGGILILFSRQLPFSFQYHVTIILATAFLVAIVVGFEGTRPVDGAPANHSWFIVLAAAVQYVLPRHDRVWAFIYSGCLLTLYIAFEFSIISIPPIWPQAAETHELARSTARVLAFLGLIAMAIAFVREIGAAEDKLFAANTQLESLLATMLPKSIAERLRDEGTTFADGYTNVTVLFADLVGFTPMSERMAPMELVSLLDRLFSAFDTYTEELGLEKIKTIGDAYMVASGLPEAREDHASAAIKLALKMRAEISRYSDLGIRIGINSGEVVAGIIGRKRFIYDLWGDTVNIAARMESHGVINEIQISESTYEAVKSVFDCVERGEVEIKGKGSMKVFLVKGFLADQTGELERRSIFES